MTDETKRLFDAPWKAVEDKDNDFPFMHHVNVCTNNGAGHVIAYDCIGDDGNRLAHLPELYDALMDAAVQLYPDAFLSNDKCRLCFKAQCKGREWIELLRKVRAGE